MNILLVEDELSKEQNVLQFLREEYPSADVTVGRSITSGIIELRKQEFDFVLLDMSLPLYDNDDMSYADDNEFETFGGKSVLDELDRRELKSKTIVITAFDILGEGMYQIALSQVGAQLKEDYPDNFVGSVFYNASSVEWKKSLKELLTEK